MERCFLDAYQVILGVSSDSLSDPSPFTDQLTANQRLVARIEVGL